MAELDESVFAKLVAALKAAAEGGCWRMERHGQYCEIKVGIMDVDRIITRNGVLYALSPRR